MKADFSMQEPWQLSTNPRERLINASIVPQQPIAGRTFGQECVFGSVRPLRLLHRRGVGGSHKFHRPPEPAARDVSTAESS